MIRTHTVFLAALCAVITAADVQAQGFPKLEDLEKNRVERVHGKELLETFTAKVIGVSDGDTLDVLTADKTKVRSGSTPWTHQNPVRTLANAQSRRWPILCPERK